MWNENNDNNSNNMRDNSNDSVWKVINNNNGEMA